jgi:DNA adenine methylase
MVNAIYKYDSDPAYAMDSGNFMTPAVKWAGGKRWLADKIEKLRYMHKDKRYVEPFCGGMAVALYLNPEKALLNDINVHLINFYRQIKNGITINLDMRNDRALYYEYRKRFNDLIGTSQQDTAEAAELFYFLNRTCFNGLCRFNNSGMFNVPFGRYNTINYRRDFMEYASAFSRWDFSSVDFEDLEISSCDFIYADPPYDVEFTRYSSVDFSWKDQERLAKWLSDINSPVVVSNQSTERIKELYRGYGFEISFVDAPRYINSNGNRDKATEIIATLRI